MTYANTITPYLCVKDAASALDFYTCAFGAVETSRMHDDSGRISHAEFAIGDAVLMISDEHPEINVFSPETIGGSPVLLVLNVADVDALFAQAVAAGATVDRPLQDSFEGALRTGKLADPFGQRWMITTQKGELG